MTETNRYFQGWSIVGWATLALSLMTALLLATFGAGEEGIRVVIRATARTSFLLFAAAFVAAALRRFWPNAATIWIRANRRYLGVSFAVSHAFHLLAILQLASLTAGASLTNVPLFRLLGGGMGYLLIAAMTATSFDRTAAWLGQRVWNLLHTTGMYVNWGIFMFSYGSRAFVSVYYVPFALVLLAALALRLRAAYARFRSRPLRVTSV